MSAAPEPAGPGVATTGAAGIVLAVTGLNREASVVAQQGVESLAGGGDSVSLRERLDALDPGRIAAVVSVGLAGALDGSLRVGDLVLPEAVLAPGGRRLATSSALRSSWTDRLGRAVQIRIPGLVAGSDRPILTVAAKAALSTATGADVVDMESHLAGAFAAENGLPFAVLRVISDEAGRGLPTIAGTAMRPDGSVDVLGVIRALVADPGQLPALIRTGRDAGRAFAVLRRVGRLLGPRLGLDL